MRYPVSVGFTLERVRRDDGKRYSNVCCDDCGGELQLVGGESAADEEGRWLCLQPEEGLEIHLSGGYDMFIDPIQASEEDQVILLCSSCAIKLCECFPYFKSRLTKHIHGALGHHCSKRKGEFIWRSYWDCCGKNE